MAKISTWLPLFITMYSYFAAINLLTLGFSQLVIRQYCVEYGFDPSCHEDQASKAAAHFSSILALIPGLFGFITVGIFGATSNYLGRKATSSICFFGAGFRSISWIIIYYFSHSNFVIQHWTTILMISTSIDSICGSLLLGYLSLYGFIGDLSVANPQMRSALFVGSEFVIALGGLTGTMLTSILMNISPEVLSITTSCIFWISILFIQFVMSETVDPALRSAPIQWSRANAFALLAFALPFPSTRKVLYRDMYKVFHKLGRLYQAQHGEDIVGEFLQHVEQHQQSHHLHTAIDHHTNQQLKESNQQDLMMQSQRQSAPPPESLLLTTTIAPIEGGLYSHHQTLPRDESMANFPLTLSELQSEPSTLGDVQQQATILTDIAQQQALSTIGSLGGGGDFNMDECISPQNTIGALFEATPQVTSQQAPHSDYYLDESDLTSFSLRGTATSSSHHWPSSIVSSSPDGTLAASSSIHSKSSYNDPLLSLHDKTMLSDTTTTATTTTTKSTIDDPFQLPEGFIPRFITPTNAILPLIIAMFNYVMIIYGHRVVDLYYIRKIYNASTADYSHLVSIQVISRGIFSFLIAPIIRRFATTPTRELWLITIGLFIQGCCLASIPYLPQTGTYAFYWFIIVQTIQFSVATLPHGVIRGLLTNYVSINLQQHILALIAAAEAIVLLFGGVLYNSIWANTASSHPTTVFYFSAAVAFITACLPIFIRDDIESFNLRFEMTGLYTKVCAFELQQQIQQQQQLQQQQAEQGQEHVIV